MEPRFTRGEYWLLETVVEGGRPLRYLNEPGVENALNKPGHGLGRESLIETLFRLFESGLIGFSRISAGGCSGPFVPGLSRSEIGAALDEGMAATDETYYGLTPEGGRQWEAFAVPRWDLYIERYERWSRSGRWAIGVIVSPDRCQAERLLDGARYMGHIVDRDYVHRRQLRPWQATYWKQLQVGYLVTYRFEQVECNWEDSPYWFMLLAENRRWYRWS
jgi:hypothetical protein